MSRPSTKAVTRKKSPTKSNPSKNSKSPTKIPPAPKLQAPWSVKAKGAVTLHLESLHGRSFTEAELIDGLNEDLRDAWAKLRAFAATLGPQRIYASALTIMFAKKVCYFFVRPKKTFLEVWIFLPREIEGLTSTRGAAKKVKYCNLFKLIHPDQVESPLTDWIAESYDYVPDLKD
jgi:Domain of unknown function (DUF5655)